MTTKHFSEADLLETYYLQPGESMPVMMHLADCRDCAARYEKLEQKLRGHACSTSASDRERPETFWKRQRISITRSIEKQNHRHATIARTLRVAAAALLAFVLGGALVYKSLQRELPKQPVAAPQVASTAQGSVPEATPKPNDDTLDHDAWQSDELREFHSVVEWESWVPDAKARKGASSL
jgi:hypothetical protein